MNGWNEGWGEPDKGRKTGDRKEETGEAKGMHPHPRPQKGKKTHSGVNSRKIKKSVLSTQL